MPHKRRRRTQAEMGELRSAMINLAAEHGPLTVRQLFYMLVSDGIIDKTEAEYKTTVVRLALDLRQSGEIAWENVVDPTRWLFRPPTYDSLSDALNATARLYRRSLWTYAQRQ